jgi:hypothetical protein
MTNDKTMATRKVASLPNDIAERIEDYRFEICIKSEAEAIRRLIELRLEAAKKAD